MLAYSSYALISERTGIALGSFVSGIVTANYNGKGRSHLDALHLVTDFNEWRAVSPITFPDCFSYDWAEWVVDWACTLGGAAYAVDEPGGNRVNGVRMSPPLAGSRLFIRARRAALNTDGAQRTATLRDANATYVRPRGRSTPRRPRVP